MGNRSPSQRGDEEEDINRLYGNDSHSKTANAKKTVLRSNKQSNKSNRNDENEEEVSSKKKALSSKMKKGKKTSKEDKLLAKCVPSDFKNFKHKNKINQLILDPNYGENHLLWSCSQDLTICAWDMWNGKCTKVLQGHTKPVTCLQIVSADDLPLSSSMSATGSISSQSSQSLVLPANTTTTSPLPSLDHEKASSSISKNSQSGRKFNVKVPAQDMSASSSSRTSNGTLRYIFSGSYDRTVRCWDVESGLVKRVYNENENWITCLLVYQGLLFCAGYDCVINVYDVESCKKLKSLYGHNKRIDHMTLSSDGVLYTASVDATVRAWDVDSATLLRVYTCRDHCLFVKTYEKYLFCGQHQEIYVWDTEKNEPKAPFVGISSFTIYEDFLIGWNRSSQHFEIWNLSSNNDQFELLSTIKDTNVLNVSDLLFIEYNDENILFYICGNTIHSKKLDFSNVIVDEEGDISTQNSNTNGDVIDNINSDDPADLNVESKTSESRKIHTRASSIDMPTKISKPTYMLYPKIFNYYAEVLMYPSSLIVSVIEELHEKEILQKCTTFDGQIDAISEVMNRRRMTLIPTTETTQVNEEKKKIVDFEIMIHPYQGIDSSVLINSGAGSSSETTTYNSTTVSTNTADDSHDVLKKLEKMTNEEVRKSNLLYTEDEYALDFETRTEIFYQRIKSTNYDPQPTIIVVRREHLVYDACKHFSILGQEDLQKQVYIYFAGEQGLDMGGITREFYQLLSEQILDPNNALFLQCSNHTYHPNPASAVNEAHLQYFRFIGKLIGRAIYDMQIMDTHFSSVIFKLLVGMPIRFDDLERVDPSMYLSMKKMLEMDQNLIETLDLSFTGEVNDFGSNNIYPLVPDGENVLLTANNVHQFINLYSRWKLVESVRPQIERLLAGVYDVIPRPYFSIFSENELELLLCGSPEINVEDWKNNAKYEGGFGPTSATIVLFWEVIAEMNQVERSKLLQFITGTSSIPHEGFGALYPAFTICKLHHVTLDYLPHAHTCLNRVDIPPYPSKKIIKERFQQAIQHALCGFFNY